MHQELIKKCIDTCTACYQICIGMAGTHCLEKGGAHVEADHFRTMLACAEMCRTSAHLLLIGYSNHQTVCSACALICNECANSCELIGDMSECVNVCRECASVCEQMMSIAMLNEGLMPAAIR